MFASTPCIKKSGGCQEDSRWIAHGTIAIHWVRSGNHREKCTKKEVARKADNLRILNEKQRSVGLFGVLATETATGIRHRNPP